MEGRFSHLALLRARQPLLAHAGIRSLFRFGLAKARQGLLACAGIVQRIKLLFLFGLAKELQPSPAQAGREPKNRFSHLAWKGNASAC